MDAKQKINTFLKDFEDGIKLKDILKNNGITYYEFYKLL
jgi:hypothetical protein